MLRSWTQTQSLDTRHRRAENYLPLTLRNAPRIAPEELDGIARLLNGEYAIMNLIPYNTVDELEFKRPDVERARAIARSLHSRRVLTKLRNSAGRTSMVVAVSCGCAKA